MTLSRRHDARTTPETTKTRIGQNARTATTTGATASIGAATGTGTRGGTGRDGRTVSAMGMDDETIKDVACRIAEAVAKVNTRVEVIAARAGSAKDAEASPVGELAEAEEWWRGVAQDGIPIFARRHASALLAEYDRRGRIVEAATAYVAYEDDGGTRDGAWHRRKFQLWIALADRVREAGDG